MKKEEKEKLEDGVVCVKELMRLFEWSLEKSIRAVCLKKEIDVEVMSKRMEKEKK